MTVFHNGFNRFVKHDKVIVTVLVGMMIAITNMFNIMLNTSINMIIRKLSLKQCRKAEHTELKQ
jgi:hypothetical protein